MFQEELEVSLFADTHVFFPGRIGEYLDTVSSGFLRLIECMFHTPYLSRDLRVGVNDERVR
jgi:hypothetical protein